MSDSHPTEEFRPVEGFPGYRVSSLGRVQSCWLPGSRHFDESRWRDVKGFLIKKKHGHTPYRAVIFYRDGNHHHRLVHRVVLETFVGPCPEGQQGCHSDDDRANNRLDNLRWDTPKANMADAIRNDHMRRGSRHGIAKLDETRVTELKKLRREGWTIKALAERFNVSVGTVCNIVNDRVWKHVT